MRPETGVTVSMSYGQCEHHAVTVSIKPGVYVLIHSDVYVLKFSDREQVGSEPDGGRRGS
jgi:hypothetical protein